MEFMYCIPDLELFIDKTIKKCLLEYDLDANDTEAVLDDMEKAWPRTPPRDSEKSNAAGPKDCNDNNTEKAHQRGQRPQTSPPGSSSRPDGADGSRAAAKSDCTAASSSSGGSASAESLAGADKSRPDSTPSSSSSSSSSLASGVERPRQQEVDHKASAPSSSAAAVANGRKVGDSLGGDSDRSGSSSPDVGDGKIVTHKPTKLKSRLQQRYFEASSQSEKAMMQSPVETIVHSYTPEPKDEYRPSNLDILASAVNLHTRREEENRLNALRDQNEKMLTQEGEYGSASSELMSIDSRGAQKETVLQSASSSASVPFHQPYRLNSSHKRLSPDKVHGMPYTSMSSQRDGLLVQRERLSGLEDTETFQKVNGLSSNSLAETVVIRREISKDMKISSPVSLHHTTNDSRENEHKRFPESQQLTFYPSVVSNNHIADIPKSGFPHSFFDQGSRIARIIAEELQKDEDCPHKPVILRNTQMVQRVNPDEIRSYANINHSPQDLNNRSDYPQYFSGNDRLNRSILLAPVVGTPHSTHPQIVQNDPSRDNHSLNHHSENISYLTKNSSSEDNQPQDLSLKPKESTALGSMDKRHLTSLLLGPPSPSQSHLNRGYFSSPNSPLVAGTTVTSMEPGLQRKSASPTVVTDRRQPFSSHPHRTSVKWARNEPVHSKELNHPLSVDPKILRDMMMADTLHRWSEARQSEVSKKRGAHPQ